MGCLCFGLAGRFLWTFRRYQLIESKASYQVGRLSTHRQEPEGWLHVESMTYEAISPFFRRTEDGFLIASAPLFDPCK